MKIEIKIPSPGESIEELELVEWLVADGSTVEKDQELATLESEKASLILVASSTGVIQILLKAPALVKVGSTACVIDEAKIPASGSNPVQKSVGSAIISESHVEVFQAESKTRVSPVARKLAELNAIDIEKLAHQGDRISKADVVKAMRRKSTESREEKVPMSQLRKKLSEKLVSVQLNTAMLTTFNEVDMFPVLELRKMYGEKFLAQYGVKLGLMSFFTKAVALALNDYRNVNAAISGNDLVFYKYADIG
ncbi:MAG: 2-oxo acid dehydrogenase subunit E2, partial [Bacteroidales bacterium]|nr:2-oxo acid dehydrogenase subunit E2 [Bacteroidales bacterium]